MNSLQFVFELVGFTMNPGVFRKDGTQMDLYFINNPDGTIRWVWPAQLSRPLFLKFYNTSSIKAKIFALGIQLIFWFKLQKVFFNRRTAYFIPVQQRQKIFQINDDWALFTGTPGPNRKAIFFIEEEPQGSFIKIPYSSDSRTLIYNEGAVLEQLSTRNTNVLKIPQVLRHDPNLLQLEDISLHGIRSTQLTAIHIESLRELSNYSRQSMPLSELPAWKKINDIIDDLPLQLDQRIPKGMLRKISRIIDAIDPDTMIDTSISHGDFTPWNMYVHDQKLHVYDWELSRKNMPLGFDMFHFVIQQGILSERKPWKEIFDDIVKTFEICKEPIFGEAHHQPEFYLQLYLIINTVLYLDVYRRQNNWHMQIDWLLGTWNEALSDQAYSYENARALVISDGFDLLQSKEYAVLKLSEDDPAKISELSDIDVCLSKKDAMQFAGKLRQHPLVAQSVMQKKSFMLNLQLVLLNGSILSIDCIWQFKRKHVEYLDLQQILNNVVVNKFGIKQASEQMEARFIGLFYGLNHSSVPRKYLHYQWALTKEKALLDQIIYEYYQHPNNTRKILIDEVMSSAQNKGINRIKNLVVYMVDSVSSLVKKGGIVVTFSGVDGAGKSTVIDNVKLILEKKLRRKVVVIRHRPSIFPILSAWKKGKAKAEKEAANSLPRQGSNASTISSFVRFGYYYTDYVLGQFIVYLKHVLRGHIVLYDRYYFDFINDGKRSNIQLPERIIRFGYRLLLKPDLNFFLYADPAVILARKQELASSTIRELTRKYLELFSSMNMKSSQSRYIPIENVELEDTIQKIMSRLMQKAA